MTDKIRKKLTPEDELRERYNVFGDGSILDPPEINITDNAITVAGRATMWVSLLPEDIDLIVNLVVGRLKKK